jgi:hypothetical protein
MDMLTLIDQLDETIRNARPVPLTDQVRIDRQPVLDLLDQMRAQSCVRPRTSRRLRSIPAN